MLMRHIFLRVNRISPVLERPDDKTIMFFLVYITKAFLYAYLFPVTINFCYYKKIKIKPNYYLQAAQGLSKYLLL